MHRNTPRPLRLIPGLLILLSLLWLLQSVVGVRPLGTPIPGDFTIQPGYRHISAPDGRTWRILFQWPWNSTFGGTVRHTSQWHDTAAPFMSHDILVTKGDYANPNLVHTQVKDHHYYYTYGQIRPQGDISLLHIFPASAEVLDQLNTIQNGDIVRISGREIFLITRYNARGDRSGYFTDMGCNTILVTNVEILP